MKNYILLFVLLLFFVSCEKDDGFAYSLDDCGTEYFYYSANKKNYIGELSPRILIRFVNDTIDDQEAYEILLDYEFLYLRDDMWHINNSTYLIKQDCNCEEYKDFLLTLNSNPDIQGATPVFGDFIVINEVLLQPKEDVDSQEIESYCSDLGLELVSRTSYGPYVFRVSEAACITGFESINIANTIYKSGLVLYSHPNFRVPTVFP